MIKRFLNIYKIAKTRFTKHNLVLNNTFIMLKQNCVNLCLRHLLIFCVFAIFIMIKIVYSS